MQEPKLQTQTTAATTEPTITINGHVLTIGQAMTVRCAIEAFATDLSDGLGDDPHGQRMTIGYMQRINDIRKMMQNV